MSEEKSKLKISFGTRDEFAAEWDKNISKGGIFINTDTPPAEREKVCVAVEIADFGQTFELDGEAVYVAPQGVGVQLNPIPPDVKTEIEKTLSADAPPQPLEPVPDVALELELEPEPESSKTAVKDDGDDKDENDDGDDDTIGSSGNIHEELRNLNRHEKLAMARKGGREVRAILIRDRDPAVVTNVLMNPRVGIGEIIQLTKSTTLTIDMIKRIVRSPEWMSSEEVRVNLVLNSKTPLPTALQLMRRLSEKNVRALAKRPIRQQLKSAAMKILVK